ncbi:uncharacterized protein (TIGR02099 family) [Sphaerotilus hippei]|uniref:Uncharacterized protein (TIGR02099 family) n=1 Tax=Sphaerotilus hippei TaxID=744406 RepID=A0A318GYN7_9BURK|nr:YhdP family protein [Sphaerotilus hippei]PXW94586.1 uncharacterized protein (TIGR02099 family) [Sphaerotilus hippei]
MSDPSSRPPEPARWLRAASKVARATAWITLGLTSIVLALWVGLHWVILPRLQVWQPQIEGWATQALKTPVKIGRIEVDGGLWAPVLRLRQLSLLDMQGRPAFRLDEVRATLTPGSLLPRSWGHWQPHLARIELQGPDLLVQRDRDGRLSLGGLRLDGPADPEREQAVADWLFSQGEWLIRGGRITWSDATRAEPPLLLEQVDLRVDNRGRHHRIELAATPPSGWGRRLDVQADLRAGLLDHLRHPGDWTRWRGRLEARLPHVDVQALRRHVSLPFDLQRGQGQLALQLEIDDGALSEARADVALQEARLQLQSRLPALDIERLDGSLHLTRDPQRTRLRAERLAFTLRDAQGHEHLWAPTTLALELRGQGPDWTGGQFTASRLDLATLATITAHLPLSDGWRRWVAGAEPEGRLKDVSWRWDGPAEQPLRWQAEAVGQQLGLRSKEHPRSRAGHPLPGRPGVQGAEVVLQASERGGRARVRLRDGELDLPGVFEETRVPLGTLDADVRWQVGAVPGADGLPDLQVDIRRATFSNPDSRGEVSGQWRTGNGKDIDRLPGVLRLDARLDRIPAHRIHRYLPVGLPAEVRHYVRDGMRGGSARQVVARVRGPIDHFPFAHDSDGEFHLVGQVENLSYDVAPNHAGPQPGTPAWPRLTHLGGELVFDRQSMFIRNASARLGETGSGGFELHRVQARIGDFVADPVLHIEGQGQGPLTDALAYVSRSPIGGWLQHSLDQATGAGPARLKLDLALPLNDLERSTAQGLLTLEGNQLQVRSESPQLEDVHGQLSFDERGFRIEGARAVALGGPLTLQGGTRPDGTVHLRAVGTATAAGLREAPQLGLLAPLARLMSGQAGYELDLGFSGAGVEVQLDSTLQGLALQAPAPLGKAAAERLPLRVTLQPASAPAPGRPREWWRLQAGPLLSVQMLRERDGGQRLLRGLVQVGRAATQGGSQALPAQGLLTQIQLPEANLVEWARWRTRAEDVGLLPPSDPTAPDLDHVPRQLRFEVDRLQVGSRLFTAVQADLNRERQGDVDLWRGQVRADQLAGNVEARLPLDARQIPQLHAHLARLSLPAEEPGAPTPVETDRSTGARPHRLPGLLLEAEQFELRGVALGRLVLEAGHQAEDGERGTWILKRLNIGNPDAQLSAVGRWVPPAAGHRTHSTRITFRLDLSDSGALLGRFGNSGALRGGQGLLAGQLEWDGSPLQFNVDSLAGQLSLGLDRGQFLRAEPGVARLLGVLSLQSLPRRLLFDFRDVFQQGFSFDRVDGDVNIQRGVAQTRNLRIRGVQALVLTEGSADLARETQDLNVWVVPDINAGAASLAYAVINPAIGLGTLIGQVFLRKPLTEAATRQFHITGRWDAPLMVPASRRTPTPGEEAPADTGAASLPAPGASATPPSAATQWTPAPTSANRTSPENRP